MFKLLFFLKRKQETIFGLQIKSLFHKLNLLYVSLIWLRNGIRTRVPLLHEGCPRPLDDMELFIYLKIFQLTPIVKNLLINANLFA